MHENCLFVITGCATSVPNGVDDELWFCSFQLYLDVLPEDKTQWISRTKEVRAQYEKIKETVCVCAHLMVVIYVSSVGFETRSWLFVLNCSTLQTLAKLQASRTWWWTTHSHRMRGWENIQFSKTIRMDGSVHYGLINIFIFFCLFVSFSFRVSGISSFRIRSSGVWSNKMFYERKFVNNTHTLPFKGLGSVSLKKITF